MRLNFQPFFLFSFCMHKFISCTIVITNLKRICDNNTYLIDLKISPIRLEVIIMKYFTKDEKINLRVTYEQKKHIQAEAEKIGMNITQYLTHLDENKCVFIFKGGQELADSIYELNNTLMRYESYNIITTDEIKYIYDSVNHMIRTFNNIMERLTDYVDIKI